MKVSSVLRASGFIAIGFAATAAFTFAYGLVLFSIWESVFDVPWPGLGNNAAEFMFRARVFDAGFGFAAGALMALVASIFRESTGQKGVIWIFLGAVVYSAMTAQSSQSALAGFLESPSPALLASFLIVGFLAHKLNHKAPV